MEDNTMKIWSHYAIAIQKDLFHTRKKLKDIEKTVTVVMLLSKCMMEPLLKYCVEF